MLNNLTERVAWAIEKIPGDRDLDWKITDVALAKILGTNKDTLAAYRKQKGGLLKGEVIDKLVSHYNFSPEWFFKGIGEPFPGARRNYHEVCGPNKPPLAAPLYNNNDTAAHLPVDDAQKINIDEAWGKTYKVLKSGTPYAVALYLNIQQFSSAVDSSLEIHACKEELVDLKAQMADMKRQLNRLTAVPDTATAQEDSLESEKKAM